MKRKRGAPKASPKHRAGRLRARAARSFTEFTASIGFDRRLALCDIEGSIAHARMLAKQEIISPSDERAILRGLEAIRKEIASGRFPFSEELEDIHMNIEARLIEKIGAPGEKLHTARSRNDQVALDLRLYIREELREILRRLVNLQAVLLLRARETVNAPMPGYTHLQRAQPIILAHHLMAYFEMLSRDRGRIEQAIEAADEMPLGAGALAGTTFRIDRAYVAKLLGFKRLCQNSLDAVSNRDFVLDALYAASTVMMHLSRLAEELILWSTEEFGFVELPERYASGSSMMPNKKNPDALELIRGKTGRAYGNLQSLLVTLKGLPLAYNRDLQEDKEAAFDSLDTLRGALDVLRGILLEIGFNREAMASAATGGHSLATDLADYLAARGMPFREAHRTIGRFVARWEEKGYRIADVSLEDLRGVSRLFEEDVLEQLNIAHSIDSRAVPGGTAPKQVRPAIARAERDLESYARKNGIRIRVPSAGRRRT